jgi:hypothetical protein
MSGPDERRFQVFVSSTYEDLKLEREKVLQAVLEMRAFPSGMELFPSADDEQWAFIQREIDSSDYYVLITAGKYGSIAPDGLSFTEKEYDFAVNLKKYVISFVRKDLARVPAGQSEMDPDRRAKLDSFHRKVKTSKLVRFYETPDDLKALVLQSLMHAFQFQPRDGWVRGRNARRIEDLEDVARLHKRVAELEAENARLGVDPMLLFAQGDDALEWEVAPAPIDGITPPTDRFKFVTSWNELLNILFGSGNNEVGETVAGVMLWRAIAAKIAECFPGCEEWCNKDGCRFEAGASSMGIGSLRKAVKLQFQGLDFVEAVTVEPRGYSVPGETGDYTERVVWRLTRRGRAQVLGIKGIRRSRVANINDE